MEWSASKPLILKPEPREIISTFDDPLPAILRIERRGKTFAGFLSYDLGRSFEEVPTQARDDLRLPLIAMTPIREGEAPAEPSLSTLVGSGGASPSRVAPISTFSRDAYLAAVQRSIDYIAAGDIFQVNLSQRFTAPLLREPQQIFAHLQNHFPARYSAYIDFGDYQIISNSPELFLKIERLPDGRRRIINRPIKGTRPRNAGMETELRDSEKDKAELAMIVDLQRNDLGRICKTGSVKVVEPRAIESLPTVYHGVATIEGILCDEVTLTDIFRATFPCGSVTGCPKIRAMEIIDELEPFRRGPYCGAIGWIAPDGTMELSVAIRTMIVIGGQVHISVGGGIVADSSPAAEYDETIVKAKAMFEAACIEVPK